MRAQRFQRLLVGSSLASHSSISSGGSASTQDLVPHHLRRVPMAKGGSGKGSGVSNYKVVEIMRVLDLVRDMLPLGKDEWERLADKYNASRPDNWHERDVESIRRKFKHLYCTRKPTGDPHCPPHIRIAKELKRSIDDKAGVIELDDDADEDSSSEEEADIGAMLTSLSQRGCDTTSGNTTAERGDWGVAMSPINYSASSSDSLAPARFDCFDAQAAMYPPARGLEVLNPTAFPLLPQPVLAVPLMNTNTNPKNPSKDMASRYSKYKTSSDRLGGIDLTGEPENKRQGADRVASEASFTKQKRQKAEAVVSTLKKQIDEQDAGGRQTSSDMFQMMLMMREDSERKAEERKAEQLERYREEQLERDIRRTEERELQEQRRREEKAEMEERRRADKIEAEERARRDKEEAHARMQEMVLLLGTLTKKTRVTLVTTWSTQQVRLPTASQR